MTLIEQYMEMGMEKEAATRGMQIARAALKAGMSSGEAAAKGGVTAAELRASVAGGKAARAFAKGNTPKARNLARMGQVAKGSAPTALPTMGERASAAAGKYGPGAAMGALGAGLLGGGALLAKKLMAKKTMGQKLIGALKANRKALAVGGAAAAGLGGLAAYKKAKG